jgi:hypothetical protein
MTTKQKVISLLFSIFFFSSLQLQAQNLQFNSAVFNEYGPFPGDGDPVTPFHTAQIVVGANQVLKLNCVRGTGINVYNSTNPTLIFPVYNLLSSSINDNYCGISSTTEELVLPTGTYTFKFFDQAALLGSYKGLINGILYDIVP